MSTHAFDTDAGSGEETEEYGTSRTDSVLDLFHATSRHVALLAAWIAMCGSLFFSEVMNWPPCLLCWYQRILMYPLTLILAIGIFRRDRKLHLYVLPFSIIGAGVALYHYLLIKTTWFPPPPCTDGVPCTVDYIDWLGFINIPFMALTAFLIITCMMVVWATLQPSYEEYVAETNDDTEIDDAAPTSTGFEWSRVAVVMIIVAVVVSFMLGSTFV